MRALIKLRHGRGDPCPRRTATVTALLGSALLAAAGHAAEAPEAADSNGDDVLLAAPTTRDHIGRIVVPVRINGQGPFRFIVDTGANHSTISPQLVRTLGLKPSDVPSVLLDGITGSALVAAVAVSTLQTGTFIIQDITMPVVWAPLMAGADGILGTAGVKQQSLWVDFERNRVGIGGEVKPDIRSESMRLHAVRLADGLLTLDTRVGNAHVRAVVDTGSERTLGNLALRDAVNIHRTNGVMAQVTSVYGATKQVETGEVLRAPPIAIGGLRIEDVNVVYGDFHIFKVWGMQDGPAMILGMDVLGTVDALGIDFRSQDVYVASARATADALRSTHASTSARTSH